jgi:hypothetical protein
MAAGSQAATIEPLDTSLAYFDGVEAKNGLRIIDNGQQHASDIADAYGISGLVELDKTNSPSNTIDGLTFGISSYELVDDQYQFVLFVGGMTEDVVLDDFTLAAKYATYTDTWQWDAVSLDYDEAIDPGSWVGSYILTAANKTGNVYDLSNLAAYSSDVGGSEVPLPAAVWFMLSGLGALGYVRKKKKA